MEEHASELHVLIVVRSRPKRQRQRPDPAKRIGSGLQSQIGHTLGTNNNNNNNNYKPAHNNNNNNNKLRKEDRPSHARASLGRDTRT